MNKFLTLLAPLAIVFPGYAIAQDSTAQAEMMSIDGESLGILTLTEMADGVHVAGSVTGIPAGEHGFHVHETGDCDPTTGFESAGAHFAPAMNQHGFENPEGPHAGDVRNISGSDGGETAIDQHNEMITLAEGEAGVFDADGSALVIHAAPDDYTTDPSGNSGDRIACGVIEATPSP